MIEGSMGDNAAHCQFCIICAKPEELRQLIVIFDKLFARIRDERMTDIIYNVRDQFRVRVTTCNAMGHISAAVRTAQIIQTSQPHIMVFLGTAASLKPEKVQIGDVVIPSKAVFRVYEKISEEGQKDYIIRSKIEGFQEYILSNQNVLISDVDTAICSEEALTAMASLPFTRIKLETVSKKTISIGGQNILLRSPKIHEDVDIFSCGMVVDSISYREFITKNTDENFRKIAIVDMESYGFFRAIEAVSRSGVGSVCSGIMIRGISDYAGRKAETEHRPEGWKEISVRNAALVAAAFINQLTQLGSALV